MAAFMNKNEGKPSENHAAFLFRNAAIGFAGLFGIVLLIRLVFVRSYNYDELSHAHMAWLVSVGDVPYRDFAANHFPFLWILMSPLMRVLPESPVALMYLRGLALLLNTVFIGGSRHPDLSGAIPPAANLGRCVLRVGRAQPARLAFPDRVPA